MKKDTLFKGLIWTAGIFLILISAFLIGHFLAKQYKPLTSKTTVQNNQTPTVAVAGSSFNTYVESDGKKIVVHVALPETVRYSDGAPVMVYVPTFFTPEEKAFSEFEDFTQIGVIEITLLYPGQGEKGGASSEGVNDYGGAASIAALRDVIKFASGDLKNTEGFTLDQIIEVNPLFDNVGLYAFSHPGLAATNVMAEYGEEISVAWFVGRENPTIDTMLPLEIGYFDENSKAPVINPLYKYPDSYSEDDIILDYSSIQYNEISTRPYFDLNENKQSDLGDYELGKNVPNMFGKRFYSVELLEALQDNGLSEKDWPSILATPEEAAELWPEREAAGKYDQLKGQETRVMLVFNQKDHVLAPVDKPHIHQAYDGFTKAGLWVRLNPDSAYMESFNPKITGQSFEHEANTEPSDWSNADSWGYSDNKINNVFIPLSAVAEMVDRTKENNWDNDLNNLLFEYDAKN